jgi:hypothetical protein
VIACITVATCALALGSTGAGAAPPPLSLVASPARVTLMGSSRQTVELANTGGHAVVVNVTRMGFGLDIRGRPRIVGRGSGRLKPWPSRSAVTWLAVRPRRLLLAPGAHASLLVSASVPRRAEPGDHQALLLLTTRPLREAGVSVRMRVGVVIVVRAAGAVVHKLALLRLRVRPLRATRALDLLVANGGNVTETIAGDCLRLRLLRRGRVLVSLRPVPRRLLPRTRGIVEFRYLGPLRGPATALVSPAVTPPCVRVPWRSFPIRL